MLPKIFIAVSRVLKGTVTVGDVTEVESMSGQMFGTAIPIAGGVRLVDDHEHAAKSVLRPARSNSAHNFENIACNCLRVSANSQKLSAKKTKINVLFGFLPA